MIYSAVEDNWNRVEIIFSVAKKYFDKTHGTEFRQRMVNGGNPFPFDLTAHDAMRSESNIVGMVMAWSVITLESLINHVLAENINNKSSAILAIEYPGQVTDKLKMSKSAKSEIAKKLIILNDSAEIKTEIIEVADELADIRNLVVHDKPFDMQDFGEGDVVIEYFKSRTTNDIGILRYDILVYFFRRCDILKEFIISKAKNNLLAANEINFSKLLFG